MKKGIYKKLILFFLIIIILLIVVVTKTSYSLFKKEVELTNINFVTGDLSYTLTSEDIENGKISVDANSNKTVLVKITSNNEIESKYKLYYNYVTSLSNEEKSNIDVGYSYLSDNTSTEEIESNEEKEIIIQITNNTNKVIEIEFGVQGGFKGKELVLKTGEEIEKAEYVIDYSGNNYNGKLMNGTKFIYDNEENMYAIDFDGVDDYVDIADLPASIDWSNGFTIEFTAKWDALKSCSRILDIGNGQSDDIHIFNEETNNKIKYQYFTNGTVINQVGVESVLTTKASYRIEHTKIENGYRIKIYKNGTLIKEETFSNGYMENKRREDNYLGKSNWGDEYFDGKIYNLKITEADGDVILWYSPNMQFDFDYTGKEQAITLPIGTYKMEAWGAQGGSAKHESTGLDYPGGKGAYTTGNITFNSNKKLYVYVGQQGINGTAYNGGGTASAGGAGATDIRFTNGAWNDFESLKSRIMVAAGGGGGYDRAQNYGGGPGGAGGTLEGCNGESYGHVNNTEYTYGLGGTQTEGGPMHLINVLNGSRPTGDYFYNLQGVVRVGGSFGRGGAGGANQAGGGSGYFGGGGASHGGAGGGSSFISGHTGCNAIEKSSTESNIIFKNSPNHYEEEYVFSSTNMIDGNHDMPKHDGTTGNMVGNSGNGYARIIYIKK